MKITNLGQAGLLIRLENLTIMVDPYFTDSVGATDPQKHRRVPMQAQYWDAEPDVLIFTHCHLDHYDPETAERILKTDRPVTVLSPTGVWEQVRQLGGQHNYVLFDRHTQWTEKGIRFTAVKAAHSDRYAIGVVIQAEGKTLCITGDTLYHSQVLADLPPQIDLLFLPVNGVGNNMNGEDAARFVKDSGAKLAVPVHVGMFDDLTGDLLQVENKVVLAAFESMEVWQ